ncbi:myotubularin-related protein 2-like [Bolinopsis microptera]|uniref:myotubularin-related protein 2-like n=1 Tax=Bolinopsis microptera TaxID=2820187 RepID=UPI003079FEB9
MQMSTVDEHETGQYEQSKEVDRVDVVEQDRVPQSSHQQAHGSFVQLPGENLTLPQEVECVDACFDGHIRGQLRLTNYRLFFSAAEGEPHDIDIPIHSMLKIDKKSQAENSYRLTIQCKQFLSVQFTVNKQERKSKDLYQCLVKNAFPGDEGKVFAYEYRARKIKENGWEVYDFVREYTRMGALRDNSKWRHSTLNKDFQHIDTYPEDLIVPTSVADETIRKSSYFRSIGRVPVLSWLHPTNEASITRCSQPCVGLSKKRCEEDEAMIAEIRKATTKSTHIYICDCRPSVNAHANKAKGKGFELPEFYENIEFSFGNIENIHEVRASNNRLRDLVTSPNIEESKWLSNLEGTKWLQHIQAILQEAVKVASIIENKKSSVVVHCSDGWDRTSQITSLAMLLLDPYYRTLQGFEVLIEKEWLSFGHQFQARHCHGTQDITTDYSPIFMQFLDCVWQITQHYPYSFQFNKYLLTFIAQHLYSCLYGTFLYDSERLRRENEVKTKTQSLWSYVNSFSTEFLNPLYKERKVCILPMISMRTIRLWRENWMAYHPFYRFQDPLFERLMELVHLREKIQSNCDELRARHQTTVKIAVSS